MSAGTKWDCLRPHAVYLPNHTVVYLPTGSATPFSTANQGLQSSCLGQVTLAVGNIARGGFRMFDCEWRSGRPSPYRILSVSVCGMLLVCLGWSFCLRNPPLRFRVSAQLFTPSLTTTSSHMGVRLFEKGCDMEHKLDDHIFERAYIIQNFLTQRAYAP